MTEKTDRAFRYIEVFKNLAEGRYDLGAWLAWWNEHKAELEAALPPGWTLRLKPRADPLVALLHSQKGCCYILDALKVPYEESDRYQQEWKQGFAQFCAEQEAKSKEKARQFDPAIKALTKLFPKFGRFLKKRATELETLEPPVTEAQLREIERSLGVILPQTYKQFLLCTRSLRIQGLDFSLTHPDIVSSSPEVALPTEGMVVIADYFLEADGDQVLFAASKGEEADPPVFYYAHAASPPHARQIAPTFSAWLESLPKSAMFE